MTPTHSITIPPLPDFFIDRQYATKHGVALWLRIYPTIPKCDFPAPWLLWIHGGAYCSGQHYQLRTWLLPLMQDLGIHVVSIAYRLTPVVSMEEMLQDGQDAFLWCLTNLTKELAGKGGVDVKRYAIGGDSSGGSLAALLGYRLQPSPKALINVYGVTDLVLQQTVHDAQQTPDHPWIGSMPEDEIKQILMDRDPTHAVTSTANAWNLSSLSSEVISKGPDVIAEGLKGVWKVSNDEWTYNKRVKDQWDVKSYIGYSRCMVHLPLRIDADTTREERDQRIKEYSLPYLLQSSKTYPPTVFLHGTGDMAVPVTESQNMANELKRIGVDTLELYCVGENHGWDNIYQSPEVPGYNEYIKPIGSFIDRHLCRK